MEGKMIVVNMHGCDFAEINSTEKLLEITEDIAKECDVTILDSIIHNFKPQGVSTLTLIAESHMSFHSWPEKGYLNFTFYTCGEVHPEKAISVLKKHLKHEKVEYRLLE